MRVLLDEQIPWDLRHYIPDHDVRTTWYMGWLGKHNGELLTLARDEFDVMITLDQTIPYEQNITEADVGIVILSAGTNTFEELRQLIPELIDRIGTVERGEIVRIPNTPPENQ